MEITPGVQIPDDELHITFVQASGPGGQNVNKVATAAQLRFDMRASSALREEVKERLRRLAGRRMTGEGVLVIEAKRYRSQEKNRADALERLRNLVLKALESPKERRPTKPTRSANRRRIESKKHRGEIKKSRTARTGSEE